VTHAHAAAARIGAACQARADEAASPRSITQDRHAGDEIAEIFL
jgi:hypothetical protein